MDQIEHWKTDERVQRHDAHVFAMNEDTFTSPEGETVTRAYLDHRGAVGVLAIDDEERVVVLEQYRHPVGMKMLELPAGLLDSVAREGEPGVFDDENALGAAQRELAEEVQLQAQTWNTLVDFCPSAGSSNESIRVFLARDLSHADMPEGFVVEAEEGDMTVKHMHLDELKQAVMEGRASSAILVSGVMAAEIARDSPEGYDGLRAPDAPWLAREARAKFKSSTPTIIPGQTKTMSEPGLTPEVSALDAQLAKINGPKGASPNISPTP